MDSEFEKLFWLFGLCIFVHVGLTAWATFRLKARHPSVWQAIGSPLYFRPQSVGDFGFLRFIGSLQFFKTRDSLLIALCIFILVTWLIGIVMFIWLWTLAGRR
jgi:hypothetical protein